MRSESPTSIASRGEPSLPNPPCMTRPFAPIAVLRWGRRLLPPNVAVPPYFLHKFFHKSLKLKSIIKGPMWLIFPPLFFLTKCTACRVTQKYFCIPCSHLGKNSTSKTVLTVKHYNVWGSTCVIGWHYRVQNHIGLHEDQTDFQHNTF